jgi:GNAT superfamily N-acetyltransferase
MAPDNSALVACLEDVMFRTPAGARGVVPLSFEGVRGRRTPLPTPFTNLVGVAGPSVEVPDASITAVIEEFGGHEAPFGWLVGPNSPEGLAARLEDQGMVRAEEFAGLALTDLGRDIPGSAAVSIREAGKEDEEQFAELLSRAFGLPPEMVAFLCEILYFAEKDVRARNYFAYVDGVAEPVAAACTIYDPNDPFVVLAGSAVVEEHRGRGIYRSLVRRRLEDVRAEGIEAAVIQAVRSTSAPICRSLGFEEVCAQELYAWSPPER